MFQLVRVDVSYAGNDRAEKLVLKNLLHVLLLDRKLHAVVVVLAKPEHHEPNLPLHESQPQPELVQHHEPSLLLHENPNEQRL